MSKRTPKLLFYLVPSLSSFLWIAVFYGVILSGQQMINTDGDLALHLNLGKYILNHNKIPLRDVFSHTMTGQPVIQHEWLSTVIFEGVNRIAGLEGIIFLCALVISTAMYLVFRFLRKESRTLLPSVVTLLLTILISKVHWLARPHIFSFLFLILWLMMLDKLRHGAFKSWWILPLLMLAWVNLHGGYIIGFITWFIYGLGILWDAFFQKGQEEPLSPGFWRVFLFAGAGSFLASLANPSGFGLWVKVVSHIGSRYLADITVEFQSPNFHDASFWPFIVFICLILLALGLSKKKFRSERVFITAAWLVMGLYSVRNTPLFAISAAPLLAEGLDRLLLSFPSDKQMIKWLLRFNSNIELIDKQLKGILWPVIGIILVVLTFVFGSHFQLDGVFYSFDPEVFPVQAVDWLKENPQEGEMFNYFTWGGYLEYKLWPEKKVFIDSKSDFYGEDFVRQYGQVIAQQDGWEDVLDEHDIDWAILPKDQSATRTIQNELGWEVIYKDKTTIIIRN